MFRNLSLPQTDALSIIPSPLFDTFIRQIWRATQMLVIVLSLLLSECA